MWSNICILQLYIIFNSIKRCTIGLKVILLNLQFNQKMYNWFENILLNIQFIQKMYKDTHSHLVCN